MPIDLVLDFTEQTLQAVQYIHSLGYIHRDLKPGNILIGERGGENHGRTVKVADFGLARAMSLPVRPMTKEIQSLPYRAPEIMLENLLYSSSVDMWSLGVIIYEMLMGHRMFNGYSEIEYLIEVMRRKGTPNAGDITQYAKFKGLLKISPLLPRFEKPKQGPTNNSSTADSASEDGDDHEKQKLAYGFADLIEQLTALDPVKRPSAKQALRILKTIRNEFQAECFEADYYEPSD